jgi:hypothetical protein
MVSSSYLSQKFVSSPMLNGIIFIFAMKITFRAMKHSGNIRAGRCNFPGHRRPAISAAFPCFRSPFRSVRSKISSFRRRFRFRRSQIHCRRSILQCCRSKIHCCGSKIRFFPSQIRFFRSRIRFCRWRIRSCRSKIRSFIGEFLAARPQKKKSPRYGGFFGTGA